MRFGDDPQQRVIAFIPKRPQPGPWVYFLFGGGWTTGSARLWAFAGNWFARHGIPAVLGGYRLVPAHRFPEPLDDVLAGFEFSLRHAEELGIQGRRAVLSGASSGGHLAALAALELARRSTSMPDSGGNARADGLLLVSAPVDLLGASQLPATNVAIEALMGHERPWPEADPLTWILTDPPATHTIPRTLLVRGRLDEQVVPGVAQAFADAVNSKAPGRAEVVNTPWTEHLELARLFLEKDPSLTALVMNWLRTEQP